MPNIAEKLFQVFYHTKSMPFALNIKWSNKNKEKRKKIKITIKNKKQEFVNNGDRAKKSCAKILMNFKPKFYF